MWNIVWLLQDHKKNLWKAYSEMYPNGMSRTTFFLNLQNGRYKYREDLGGLCSICSDYGYNVFEDLNKIITKYLLRKKKVKYIPL